MVREWTFTGSRIVEHTGPKPIERESWTMALRLGTAGGPPDIVSGDGHANQDVLRMSGDGHDIQGSGHLQPRFFKPEPKSSISGV